MQNEDEFADYNEVRTILCTPEVEKSFI